MPIPAGELGACWPMIKERLAYFTYGSYPIPQRWRVDIVFVLGAIGLVWVLWIDAPRRDLGASTSSCSSRSRPSACFTAFP